MHDDQIEQLVEAAVEAIENLTDDQGRLLNEATSALPRDWDEQRRLKWIFSMHGDLGCAPLVAIAKGDRSVVECARVEG